LIFDFFCGVRYSPDAPAQAGSLTIAEIRNIYYFIIQTLNILTKFIRAHE